jgi:hypothetical protein
MMDRLMERIAPSAEDGPGWLLIYVCRLLRMYPSFTREMVWFELPMEEGWAYYSAGLEIDPWMQFCGAKRKGKGYIGRAADKLMAELKKHPFWIKNYGKT